MPAVVCHVFPNYFLHWDYHLSTTMMCTSSLVCIINSVTKGLTTQTQKFYGSDILNGEVAWREQWGYQSCQIPAISGHFVWRKDLALIRLGSHLTSPWVKGVQGVEITPCKILQFQIVILCMLLKNAILHDCLFP